MGDDSLDRIFIGSTVRDLNAYRLGVRQKLLEVAGVHAELSEDWVTGHALVVDECRLRVQNTDGYFGIFGYYYGWTPAGETRSITHLEYLWALEKWGQAKPVRLAVFMPGIRHTARATGPCEAERELKDLADPLVQAYPGGQASHQQAWAGFHQDVQSKGRIVQFFESLSQLLELALVTSSYWRGMLDAPVAGGARPDEQVSDRELGRLGRRKQREAIEDIVSWVRSAPEVPGAALLAYGNEESGLPEFLAAVAAMDSLNQGRPPVRGRPPPDSYEIPDLVAWLADMTGAGGREEGPITTVGMLADHWARQLHRQDVVVLIDQIGRLSGGVARFHQDLWLPLFEALRNRRQGGAFSYHLYLLAADEREDAWDQAVLWNADADEQDFGRLLALPELGDIRRADLNRWLRDIEVPDEPPGHLENIIGAALIGAENQPDGTPVLVFRRLRGERLFG